MWVYKHNVNMPDAGRRSAFYWLLVVAFLAIAAGFGLRDPWPADEPRFALIAKDMVDTGRWFFPRVAEVLYPDKPPLYFWLMGAFYSVTGSIRFSFLLPSLCAALLTLLLTHDLVRRLWGDRQAWWATASLLVCIQFMMLAKSARIDATIMMLVTLGMYGILRHLLLGPDWKWYVIGFAASGLGIITKGVGFLPVFVFLAYAPARWLNWQRISDFPARWWQWLFGPAAMFAVIAAWLVPMLWLVAAGDDPALQAYRDNILFKQTGERYADPWHHFEPAWYYLVKVIPLFWFPLSLALIWLIPAWLPAIGDRDARLILPLAWVVFVIVFFSLSPAKRGTYLLPALPMLAVCAGPFLLEIVNKQSVRVVALGVLAAVVALLVGALAWIEVWDPSWLAEGLNDYDLEDEVTWLVLVLAAAAVCCFGAAWRFHAVTGLAAWLVGFWLVLGMVGYPLLNDARTPISVMRGVEQAVGAGKLGLVGWKEQHILFANRPVVHFGYRRQNRKGELHDGLAWLLKENKDKRYLLVTDKHPLTCIDLSKAVNMGYRHRQSWYLVVPRDVEGSCRSRLERRRIIGKTFHANRK
ncbi:MAG: Undecaprenyl phosphate-alpha-4-amino-4-deoxy-L-arabinose arabinosyl transferase [Gammaproteobacteria bacterium]|nr:Undecaprenyl phosphate-alpha-4-amino-4-deoxy-L-arabinose arabinosyl transferase [Gammaproteobacteria bacterium]